MARLRYRYELWVPIERAKEGRDALYRHDASGEPRRGPDVPATPDTLAYATYLTDVEAFGLMARKFLKREDAVMADYASRLGGHVVRYPIEQVHISGRSSWAPTQSLGPHL